MPNTLVTAKWLTAEYLAQAAKAMADMWDERAMEIYGQTYGLDSRATLPAIPPMPARKTDCSCAACQYGALLAEMPPPEPEAKPEEEAFYGLGAKVTIRVPQRFQVRTGQSYSAQAIADKRMDITLTGPSTGVSASGQKFAYDVRTDAWLAT